MRFDLSGQEYQGNYHVGSHGCGICVRRLRNCGNVKPKQGLSVIYYKESGGVRCHCGCDYRGYRSGHCGCSVGISGSKRGNFTHYDAGADFHHGFLFFAEGFEPASPFFTGEYAGKDDCQQGGGRGGRRNCFWQAECRCIQISKHVIFLSGCRSAGQPACKGSDAAGSRIPAESACKG